MFSVIALAAAVASAVIVNVLVPAVDVVVVRRVIRLTWFTLANEILSPFFTVSPVVAAQTIELPDWFAPLTVTPVATVAHTPVVCVYSELEAYQSKESVVPT